MNAALDRAELLLSHGRYRDAEGELRRALAAEPGQVEAHFLLSLCLAQQEGRVEEACDEAHAAIASAPDYPLGHYALAVAMLQRNRPQEAKTAIGEAIRLDPDVAGHWAVLARAELALRDWPAALDAAQRGLRVDPEHVECGNLRAFSLERLGHTGGAVQEARRTLARDPDNAGSHVMLGIALLREGQHGEAQAAFREALRLDPNDDAAREYMLEALRSGSPLFRLVQRFHVTLSRLGAGYQFLIIFGAWFGFQLLSQAARNMPLLQPLVLPALMVYLAFALLTWIADPLFNVFLRLHPFGRYLLNRRERLTSDAIAACLLSALGGAVLGTVIVSFFSGLVTGWYWLMLTIAVAAAFRAATPQRTALLAAAAVLLAALPPAAIFLQWAGAEASIASALVLFAYGMFGVQILANMLAARPVRI